jgi:spermidine/putrescine transport system permease protein
MAQISLKQGSIDTGYQFTWHFATYTDAISNYSTQLLRSFWYAGAATLISLLVGYPLAYAIAFRGGKWKNALLLLVILPFFTTYLVRTLSWQTILSDDGVVVSFLRTIGVLGPDGRLLATSTAVIAGITYNFLPFMILPLYASLERIDQRLVEAAEDLYGRRRDVLLRVVVPLSMPGIVAGVLLTFIPAAGDFVNAELLGTPEQAMIGNVIQSRYLDLLDYPTATALSFILMIVILVMVLVYARSAGTEALTGAEESPA